MKTKRMKLSDMNPAPYNPRVELKPGDVDFDKLVQSIETFGNVEPILYNERTGNIVGGHQRWGVLKHLGEKETDAVVIDIPLEEEKLLNIALNQIKGEWDREKLSELLSKVHPAEAHLSGFSPQEIMLLVSQANERTDDLLSDYDNDRIENDNDDWENDRGNFEDDEDEEEDGEKWLSDGLSYVVSISFDSADRANDWLEEHDINGSIKPGSRTTVIRMDGE